MQPTPRSAVVALASFTVAWLLCAVPLDAQIVNDTFNRPNNPTLGSTEFGQIPWGTISNSNGSATLAAPTITNNALSFVSYTDNNTNVTTADLGVGTMRAYLAGFTAQNLSLSVNLQINSSVLNEDQWMGMSWRTAIPNGAYNDGCFFYIRQNGSWIFQCAGATVKSGATTVGNTVHTLEATSIGNHHIVKLDGVELVNTNAYAPTGGGVLFLSNHGDTTTNAGFFDRTFDNFQLDDLGPMLTDTFTRSDNLILGTTETVPVIWTGMARSLTGSTWTTPSIASNKLSFVSYTDGDMVTTTNDVGMGIMQAYLAGYLVQNFTLGYDMQFTSTVNNEDQWLGVVWRKSQDNGAVSDGCWFYIRQNGAWYFSSDGVTVTNNSGLVVGNTVHTVTVTAIGNCHTVKFDGATLFTYTDTNNPNPGYISFATAHNDSTANAGIFARTVDNFYLRDLGAMVTDSFSRPNNSALGVTENGGALWVGVPRNSANSTLAAPTITNSTLSFVSSTDADGSITSADVGLGTMQAYLTNYTVRNFKLGVDIQMNSAVLNEDQWMAVQWRKAAPNGGFSDGYIFYLRQNGQWYFVGNNSNIITGSGLVVTNTRHSLEITAIGERHALKFDGTELFSVSNSVKLTAGYIGFLTYHSDSSPNTGVFDRTYDNFYCQNHDVFTVESFGATPDDASDDSVAIRNAIRSAAAYGPGRSVAFKPGAYRVSKDGSTSYCLNVTGSSGLTLEGNGAQLLVTSPEAGCIQWQNAQQCTLRGLTIDYDPLPLTQGRITNVYTSGPNAGKFDLLLDAGYPLLSETWFTSASSRWGMIIDPVKRQLKPNVRDYVEATNWTSLGGTAFRVAPTDTTAVNDMAVNDRYVQLARQISGNAIILSYCTNSVIENVTIRSSPSLAVGLVGCTGQRVSQLSVAFAPGSTRLITTDADGVHCQQNRVGPRIENSFFEGMADDAVNIYCPPSVVYQVISDTHVVVGNKTRLAAGDSLQVLDSATGLIRGYTTAASVVTTNSTNYAVIFTVPVTGMHAGTDVTNADNIFNLSASGEGYVITNNTMQASRRHGTLLRSGGGVVEGNRMIDLGGQAVVIANERSVYVEGPVPRNIVVRSNYISGVGQTAYYKDGAIEISATKNGMFLANGYSVTNISIIGNTISNWAKIGIYAGAVRDVLISNNVLVCSAAAASYSGDIRAMRMDVATGIAVKNTIITDPRANLAAGIHLFSTVAPGAAGFSTNNVTFNLAGGVPRVIDDRTTKVVHVHSITMSWVASGSKWKARAVVNVRDDYGNVVNGATVTGNFTGAMSNLGLSGASNASGDATITSTSTITTGTVTFTVTNITGSGLTYNSSANVETSDVISR